ncbi:hypothetical protein HDU96_002289, partial [Phlyctochytrium bullatum]
MAATGPTDAGTPDSFVLEVQSDNPVHLRLYEPASPAHDLATAPTANWVASLSDHDLLYTDFRRAAEVRAARLQVFLRNRLKPHFGVRAFMRSVCNDARRQAARRVLANHRKRLQGARLDAAARADLKNAW